MLNKKMKQVASVLSISALLGTTIVTPLGVLSTNAALAQAATAATPTPTADANPNLMGDFSVYALPTTMGDTYRFNNYVFGSTPAFLAPSEQTTQKISTLNTLTKVAGQPDTFTMGKDNLKKITLLGADKNGISIDNKGGDGQQQLAIGYVGSLVPGKEYSFSFSTTFDKPGQATYNSRYISVSAVYSSASSNNITIPSSAGSYITSSGNITGTFKAGQGADKYSSIQLNVYTPTGAVITISDFTLTKSPAQEQADLQSEAQTAVNNLFTGGNTANDIKAGLTQDEIDNAKNLVSQLPDSTLKNALTDAVNKAQTQLDQQNDAAAYNAARAAVNDLFANKDTSGAIKVGLTQADIDAAQALADKVVDPTKKAELQKDLDKAKQLLDANNAAAAEQARQEEALASIKDLFNNNDTTGTIKDVTNQDAIDAAQKTVDAVTNPTKKAELQNELNEAQAQLDARNAAEAAEKANQAAAEASVKDLFNNNDTTGTIKDATNQAAIDAAQKAIDAVTDPVKKASLQKDLNEAQTQLDAKKVAEAAAQDQARQAVNNLFTNQDPAGLITVTVTQANIDAAQSLVNKVTDPAKKADLQKDLDAAQTQLNAKNEAAADASVKGLFNNNDTTGTIKDATNQVAIDVAQKTIDAVKDPAKKADLQKELNEAQTQLDARNAAEVADKGQQVIAGFLVNQLYQNNDPSTDAIKDTTIQATIDAAQAQVDLLLPSAVKTDLQNKVNRAKELLDQRNKEAAADTSVKGLFNNNDTTGTIKDTTNQTAIDAAQKTIDAVTDPTKKATLQKELNEAQTQLDTRNAAEVAEKSAREGVNNLFTNQDPTGNITGKVTQKDINAAQDLVDKVKDPTKKAALQKDLDAAQKQLNDNIAAQEADKTQQAVATFAVNQLFQNNDPGTDAIKTTTTQTSIDTAQAQVDLLLPSAVKTDLQNKINRAQELLDAKNQTAEEQARQAAATASVKDLFNNNDVNGTIKDSTDQKAIDAAQKTIDAVTDPTKKAELQSGLDKAQQQLNDKASAETAAQNQARQAVNNLFTNQDPTGNITGTLTQSNIDAAQALINKVTDPTKKAELQSDLNKAQQQLTDRNNAIIAVPQLNPMTEADTVFSGKLDVTNYNPGTIRIFINNVATTIVPVDANGNFTYNIGNRKAGDVISVDYKDRTGQYNAATKASITVTPVLSTTVINKMTENDDTISGTTTPNAKVRYVVNGQAVNIGYADASGNYSKYVGVQTPGTVVGVEVFDVASNQYKPAVTTTVKAVNVTIAPMTTADDTVTGKAPANAKLRISINGVAVNVTTADADGNYSKLIGKQAVGTVVSIEMFNTDTGKYEFAKGTTVTSAAVSIEYTVNAITTNDDTLTGKAPANAKLRYAINGQLVSVITADTSGNYSKFIGKQKEGTVVSVALLNANTNQYTAYKDITVSATTDASSLAPVINTIVAGTGVVSGTVPQGVTTVRTWVNGVAQVMVPVTDGTFTWTKTSLKEGDTVKVDYKDATGNWISAEKVVTK
ncbi:toxin Cry1Ac domain D-VI-related protein [Listeria rocourtiae]|uniref:toxin Cry1Ac domain D-VI-related protein n=1 Tax=Listeria rocourtiae TaxID=647910 RepID=UPI003D2F885E